MIVCLPFHKGDIELARLNLKLLAKWPQQPFSCVLCVDDETDPQEIASLAAPVFAEVRTVVYPHYSGPNRQWPRPQNWAWQQTARRMESQKYPWLWWEQDAVPLKPDWLKSLAQAYDDGNQPFMGAWVDYLGHQYMAGVGVYPPRVNAYCPHVLIVESAAFDVFLGKHIASQCHRINELINHEPDARNGLIESGFSANGAVLFHKCKDGSLQRKILNSTGPIGKLTAFVKRSMIQVKQSDITVVITNFQRPTWVKEAFDSCLKSGIRNIVVTASGTNSELKSVHDGFRKLGAVVDAISGDEGCNEMWLRGVRLARTKRVLILHDDDRLLPGFLKCEESLTDDVGFVLYPGSKHGPGSDPKLVCQINKPTGNHHTDSLWPFFLTQGNLSFSPVAGVFWRDHLVSVLEECESEFKGPNFQFRENMMVGNDLLIWIRALENHPRFRYVNTPLVSYGNWEGSCTYSTRSGDHKRLRQIYDATRDYYLRGPEVPAESPLMAHVYSWFNPPANDRDRYQNPVPLWLEQYRQARWVHLPVPDGCLPRCFQDPKRTVPYVKDLIDYAFKTTLCDVAVLVNMDILPNPSLSRLLVHELKLHPALYAFRRNVPRFIRLDEKQIRMNTEVQTGIDLIAVKREWWTRNRQDYPDLLFATEAWDYAMRLFMNERGGKGLQYLIYHVAHPYEGQVNAGSPSQNQNRSLIEPFLKSRGQPIYWHPGQNTDKLLPR